MSVWEIILISIALSMDAVAVGMTNGMVEPNMRIRKMLCVAGAYALFQFLMPVLGYYCSYAFSSLVEKIAPWLSFALLGFIGGKMILDFIKDVMKSKKGAGESAEQEKVGTVSETDGNTGMPSASEMQFDCENAPASEMQSDCGNAPVSEKKLGFGKLLLQAVATSVDALAVGVTLLAAETTEGLPFHVTLCALLIGAVTFTLSYGAVVAGKRIGNKFADKAGLLGGLILVAIGLKILIEGLI